MFVEELRKRGGIEDVGRRLQADRLIEDILAQPMRADGERNGVIKVGRSIT